jgi:predicted dehydrogenase
MRDVRVGIVGGGFAASSHVDALRRVPGVVIAAVASSSENSAARAADRLQVPRAYAHYGLLVEDDSIDAIHNCSPNHLHAEVNQACLQAGKHLLSEKPLALDSNETGKLVEVASSSDAVAGVCFNYRHYPLIQQLRADLDETLTHHFVHGGYLQDWLVLATDWNWRLEVERAGPSRALADIGSHWIDLVQHVTGDEIVQVSADLATLHPERHKPTGEVQTFSTGQGETQRVAVTTEDFASVMVRFASGARGVFSVSQVSPGRKNRLYFEIDTSERAFAWDQQEPNRLWIGHRDRANQVLMRDPGLLGARASKLAHFPGGHEEGWPDALRNLFLDFYTAIAARRNGMSYAPSFATFEQAHRVVLVVEAALKSARSGGWVETGLREGG